MRIDARLTGMIGTTQAPANRAASGARFKLPDARTAATREGGAARAAAPLATLDALLALQGEEDPEQRRKRHARRGTELLEALDRLKAALLSGRVSQAELKLIADRLAAAQGGSGDPGLDAVLQAIELRARVELAKLGIA